MTILQPMTASTTGTRNERVATRHGQRTMKRTMASGGRTRCSRGGRVKQQELSLRIERRGDAAGPD
eukprot:scaffold54498_cov31-Tisochrysis_lutea.AAC.4